MYNDKEIEEILEEKCGIKPESAYVNKEDLICSCKAVTDNLTDMMTGILEKQDEKVQIAQGNIDAIYKAFGDKPIVPQGLSSMSAKNPGLPPLKTEESDEASVTNMLATKTISIVMAGVTVGVAAVALAIWVVDYKTRKAGINSGKLSKTLRDILQKIRDTYGVAKPKTQVEANLGQAGFPFAINVKLLKEFGYADEKGNWIKFEGESFRKYGIAEIERLNTDRCFETLNDIMFLRTFGYKKGLYFNVDILPAELSFWLVKLGYLTEENHSFTNKDKKNELLWFFNSLNLDPYSTEDNISLLEIIKALPRKEVERDSNSALLKAVNNYRETHGIDENAYAFTPEELMEKVTVLVRESKTVFEEFLNPESIAPSIEKWKKIMDEYAKLWRYITDNQSMTIPNTLRRSFKKVEQFLKNLDSSEEEYGEENNTEICVAGAGAGAGAGEEKGLVEEGKYVIYQSPAEDAPLVGESVEENQGNTLQSGSGGHLRTLLTKRRVARQNTNLFQDLLSAKLE